MRRMRVPLLMLGVLGSYALLMHLHTSLYDDSRQLIHSGMDKVCGGDFCHNTVISDLSDGTCQTHSCIRATADVAGAPYP